MRLQYVLPTLVFAMPVLIVGFAALAGGSWLARAAGDIPGAELIGRMAGCCAILLFMDLVLLVGTLGVRALVEDHWRDLRRQSQWERRQSRCRGRSSDRDRPEKEESPSHGDRESG